ncbi:lytic murein transglycosylase [Streptomyces sp. NPDC051219]|uniref:lytic transglycosylase domain-containing protein n=1 Tax=Streptomyces sp. NPDC051219 TaxID=3155283 RepID=UPI003447942B
MPGRKHGAVRGTAVAAAAMAALTASQAPGQVAAASAPQEAAAAPGHAVPGDTAFRTELPPLRTLDGAGAAAGGPDDGSAVTVHGGVPATVLDAYLRAESALADSDPGCHLRRQLLAAIGQVESGQARGGRVTADGTTLAPILGPRLDGDRFALIRDTDGGAYDGDSAYDRAVGPMQFIPSTWAGWGADGNGDGRADPNNVYDAALAAGRYLCAAGGDLADPAGLDRAILGYNHSEAYLRTVRAWYAYYLEGHFAVPDHHAGAGDRPKPQSPAPEPSSSRPARPEPSPSATAAPGTPTPSPTRTAPGSGPVPAEPLFPLPGTATATAIPGDGVLPGALPQAGSGDNGKDSMSATPSTTPATRR